MRLALALAVLLAVACARPAAEPRTSEPSIAPGQSFGCDLVFLVGPAARCVDR